MTLLENVGDGGRHQEAREGNEAAEQAGGHGLVVLLDLHDRPAAQDDLVDHPSQHVQQHDGHDGRREERREASSPAGEVAGDADADHHAGGDEEATDLESSGHVPLLEVVAEVVRGHFLVEVEDADDERESQEVEHDRARERQPTGAGGASERALEDEAESDVERGLDDPDRQVALEEQRDVLDLGQERPVDDELRRQDGDEDVEAFQDEPERGPPRVRGVEVWHHRQHGDDLRGAQADTLEEVGVVVLVEELLLIVERREPVEDVPEQADEADDDDEARDGANCTLCERGDHVGEHQWILPKLGSPNVAYVGMDVGDWEPVSLPTTIGSRYWL